MLGLTFLLSCGGGDTGTTSICVEPEVRDASAACEAFTGTPACPLTPGSTWVTVTEGECGPGVGGDCSLEDCASCGPLCFWWLEADEAEWVWSGSDYNDSGAWSCDGGEMAVSRVDWSFDPETCLLTWSRGEQFMQVE